MGPEIIKNYAFETNVEQFSAPFLLSKKWHIVQVKEIIPASPNNYDVVRPILEKELKEQKMQELKSQWYKNLEDKVAENNSLEYFSTFCNATINSEEKKTLESFEENHHEKYKIMPILIEHSFQIMSKNSVSLVTYDHLFVVLSIDDIIERHDLTYEEAKNQIKKEWEIIERDKITYNFGQLIQQQWQNESSLNFLTKLCKDCTVEKNRTVLRPGDETLMHVFDPLIAAIFKVEKNQVTSPVVGDNGSYNIAKIHEINFSEIQVNSEKYKEIYTQLQSDFKEDLREFLMKYLQTRYKVSINPLLELEN